jgi:hypothetical protein
MPSVTRREKQPEDVFTPRAATVNERMYVERPELQVALAQALRGSMNIIIHGESGSGKSWLYKHVFAKNSVEVLIANMANAMRLGSLQAEFQSIINREGTPTKTGYTAKMEGGISLGPIGGKIDRQEAFTIAQKEPFEVCLEMLRARAGDRPACLVMDNLEHIFGSANLMEQVGSVLVLLDDPRYAAYGVKVVLVGVPDDIRRYFSQVSNVQTIANRLTEIPEVARLSERQTAELVLRGLVTELKYRIGSSFPALESFGKSPDDEEEEDSEFSLRVEDEELIELLLRGGQRSQAGKDEHGLAEFGADSTLSEDDTRAVDAQMIVFHVAYVTDRIPQQVHEYCLELARRAERNAGIISLELLAEADAAWMSASLTANATTIENLVRPPGAIGRRKNQTIYALGRCRYEDFGQTEIEKIVRQEFPESTKSIKRLNVGQILAEFATSDPVIIKRTPRGDKYRFTHPKYRMAIRVMLKKTFGDEVRSIDQRLVG